jgi:hypothetical protein
VAQETTYVKLTIGAPMSQGVVEVKRIREYIRAHGGYQVDPVASPNWVLMPDGSTRSARRQVMRAVGTANELDIFAA